MSVLSLESKLLLVQVLIIAIAVLFRRRVVAFGVIFGTLLIGYAVVVPKQIESWTPVYTSRNFFGVKRVLYDRDENTLRLEHGDTIHGLERLDPEFAGEPLGYYLRGGPLGNVMAMLGDRANQRVAVVGLGAGTVAAYGSAALHVTFFEIDPQILDIAQGHFSFLRRCGANCDVVIGDGRLSLQSRAPLEFDVIVLDAFNSDSIPAHLISREAVRMYASKLKPQGILLFHVPSRYLQVAELATAVAVEEGLIPFARQDYIAAVGRAEYLGDIPNREAWVRVNKTAAVRAWTDDYSNLLNVIRWH
jgi:spermidine synthase